MSKPKSKVRVSSDFLKEVSERVNMINTLSKESGVEIPNELEETLREMSIHSSRREGKIDSPNNSPNDSSIESSIQQIKINTDYLCKAMKDTLQICESSKENRLEETVRENQRKFQSEDCAKSSVMEAACGGPKKEIFKMNEKTEEEKFEEFDLSAEKGPADSSNMLIEQIKELHKEIFLIQNRIEKSEQDLKQKELENKELKDVIERLNESFERFGDGTESGNVCQNCEVM